jgi:hypothetical protein
VGENFMKDPNVRRYYESWVHREVPLGTNLLDREYFYRFVKACVKYAGRGKLRRKLNTDLLKLSLYDDWHERYPEDVYDEMKFQAAVLFEELLEYEDTTID